MLHSRSRQLLILLALIATPFYGIGQSTFHFRFSDAVTGIRTIPERVEISLREESKTKYTIEREQIANNGATSIHVKDGIYDVVVYTNGYKNMSTWFEVRGQELKVNFKLDPENRVKELTPDYIGALHSKSTMVITGFVVDGVTGLPLGSVMISSADNAVTTQTDSNGYYVLQLPLTHSRNELERRSSLVFAKKNYTTEIRQRFDMWPLGDLILPVKMNAGAGENTANVIEKREIHQEIIKP